MEVVKPIAPFKDPAVSPSQQGAKPLPTIKEVIDILLHTDSQSVKKRMLIFELQTHVQDSEFAEAFLENDGLHIIMQQIKSSSGSVQGGLLQVLRGLLVYVNAIDQLNDSPELIEAIYGLLIPTTEGTPVSLSVVKPTLEILIVTCGIMENGHKYINDAAKHRIGVNMLPYSPLIPYLSSPDLITIRNTLLFMNIIMRKKKNAAEVKAKKLLFRWKEAGILSLLKPLTAIEDEAIQKQLTALQKTADFTIPRSWEEAYRFKRQLDETNRKYEVAIDSLFIFQQQQAKMRLLKNELRKAQETIQALRIILPSASAKYHPTKRFADGGGLPVGALVSTAMEPIDTTEAMQEITKARRNIFDRFISSDDFKTEAQKIVGYDPRMPMGMGSGMGGHHRDPFQPPPPDDFDDDDLPPPSDDGSLPPSDDGSLPPSDDDMPSDGDGGEVSGVSTTPGGGNGAGAVGKGGAPLPGAAVGEAPDTKAPAAPGSGPVPVPGKKMGAPPPPPPGGPGKKGGPPPPPGAPGAKMRGAVAQQDTRKFFRGPAPVKKMKPLHWDKIKEFTDDGNSIWHKLYRDEIKCAFDYEEFENMFSQKEVEEKKVTAKPKAILLMDEKIHQNLAIMLHKLPNIPNIQRALLELDGGVLTRESLIVMRDQCPAAHDKQSFERRAHEKPVEQYSPSEKYMAMVIGMPEFDKRVSAWLFTMEWSENVQAALQPMTRMEKAIECVLASSSLPYYIGVLLGFGNMMNYGTAKGNAPAVNLNFLSKLEMTKDNRGKISLYAHMFKTVKTKNPKCMIALPEEMKPLFDGVKGLKSEDFEKSLAEAEKAVSIFESSTKAVKKHLVANGTDSIDPFIPLTTEFSITAASELKLIHDKYKNLQALSTKLGLYFNMDTKKQVIKPESILDEIIPFVDRVKRSVADEMKESRRAAKKGQKINNNNNDGIGGVVGKLQEEMVTA